VIVPDLTLEDLYFLAKSFPRYSEDARAALREKLAHAAEIELATTYGRDPVRPETP
jgi:hypothetical protein